MIGKDVYMLRINPNQLGGLVAVPSSKSIGHRVMICAALSDGVSIVRDINMSDDLEATIEALQSLGASFEAIDDKESEWVVGGINRRNGICQPLEASHDPLEIYCKESGSTLRFMIPVALAVMEHIKFTGSGRLVERPINEYFPILQASGIEMNYNGNLPFGVKGKLLPGNYRLSGRVSSQYTSGMLLAAPLLKGKTQISIEGKMESKAYIDLTIDTMKQFGVEVNREDYKSFSIGMEAGYKPTDLSVEADYSQAAFWIVAGLIGKQPIALRGLKSNSSQGDRAVLEIAKRMGGQLSWEGDQLVAYPSKTLGTIIDASQCPDLIPVLCVLAALSDGETRVINGQRLRVKESDRILATVTELQKLGADIQETEDGMIIKGQLERRTLKGNCEARSWGDHRIAMAVAVAASVCEGPVTIEGAEAVCKSYPRFFADYIALGGQIDGQYIW